MDAIFLMISWWWIQSYAGTAASAASKNSGWRSYPIVKQLQVLFVDAALPGLECFQCPHSHCPDHCPVRMH